MNAIKVIMKLKRDQERELNRRVTAIEKQVNRMVRGALWDAAGVFNEKARDLAPRDTGALKASFRRWSKYGTSRESIQVLAGPGRVAWYSHLVEFGTGPRVTKSGANRGSMPATPFMRPAWSASESKIRDIIRRKIWVKIKGIAEGKWIATSGDEQ